MPDGGRKTPITAVAITHGLKPGLISIQAISDTTDRPTLPMSRTTVVPKSSGTDKESSILTYKPRSKDNLLRSLTNYGIYLILIYKTK